MIPPYRLDDPRFVWIPSGQTDVQRTWRKYGWTPPSEKMEQKRKDPLPFMPSKLNI